MASPTPLLRLPFQLRIPSVPAAALKITVAAGVAVAVMNMRAWNMRSGAQTQFVLASMSLSSGTLAAGTVTKENVAVEATTGMQFPRAIQSEERGKLELAGTGLRKKSILGLKSIIVYAFGMYVNGSLLNDQVEKTKKSIQVSELPCMDTEMSVRLVIVYGKLKIGSVRSAFEESVGSRITKFTGSDNKQLLHSFTGLFKDEIKLPKGTTIDLVRLPGHILRTKINGEEIGSVKSELLCRCVFDLYIGDEPFDAAGKDAIASGLASILDSQL